MYLQKSGGPSFDSKRGYEETEILSMSVSEVADFVGEWARLNEIDLNLSALNLSGQVLMVLSSLQLYKVLGFKTQEDSDALYSKLHSSKQDAFTISGSDLVLKDDMKQQIQDQGLLFSAPYKDPTNMVDAFIAFAQACFDHFQANSVTFNSPYFCLVQSSGYGKTRLLREVARKARVLYVCMRSEESTYRGYPQRSSTAIRALFGGLDKESVANYVEGLSARFAKCFQYALTNLPEPGVNDKSSHASFPSERLAEIVWKLDDMQVSGEMDRSTSNELVILVLDEARATLNNYVGGISRFHLIRRALAYYSRSSKQRKLVIVFVDTSSRIQKNSPSSDKEQSLRFSNMDNEMIAPRLYMPFIIRHSFDANFKPYLGYDLSSLVGSYEYLKAGRPLVSMPSVAAMSESVRRATNRRGTDG